MKNPTPASLLLLLISFSGVLSETSLDGKVFVFPSSSDNSYVLLKPALKQPLQRFTICLSFFTDLSNPFSLISVASREQDNEILLMKCLNEYETCVRGQCIRFNIPGNIYRTTSHWENACMTWEASTGIIQLWIDGQPLPRKGIAKGLWIPNDVVAMLGQEQDSYGGSLDAGQCFIGEMAKVYMWDTVLPPEQLQRMRKDAVPPPLVDWTALDFEIKGYVVIEPALQ
ncbi:mucosal pentraxin-like isoform X2 [Anolis sagrei]|uniref:mucosal pentraxin-like isoform X2 n=1 Tax=Anolis sagrei TaxID=38937 RepID=UPI003521850A